MFFRKQKRRKLYIEKSSAWFLLLLFMGLIIATGCKSSHPRVQPSSAFDSVTFRSGRIPSGIVNLTNGEYHEIVSTDDDSGVNVHLDDHMAVGKYAQTDMAAVILVSDIGAGEVYYDLALLQKTPSGWENTDTVELGDRVKIQSVAMKDDEIQVELKVHGPYDRPCCATLERIFEYKISGGKLVKVPDAFDSASLPELEGTLWKWQETYYKNDSYIQSYDPNAYTVQMIRDKGLSVRADCNMAGGKYVLNSEYLDFQITHSTRAACPPESLSDAFLADLNTVVRYYFKNHKLYIVLKKDAGVMVFSY